MDLENYFEVVDKKTIPEHIRIGKYNALVEQAKELGENDSIRVEERENVSLPAIASQFVKLGYKITRRTIDEKKVLFISNKTE